MPPKLNFAAAMGGSSNNNNNQQQQQDPSLIPTTIREFTSGGAKQKGIMPKQLSIDRLKMFSKDIDHLTCLLSKRRFGTVMWDTDLPDALQQQTSGDAGANVLSSTADPLPNPDLLKQDNNISSSAAADKSSKNNKQGAAAASSGNNKDARSPQQNDTGVTCCDVITTPLVINMLSAWLPPKMALQLRSEAKAAMNIAADFQVLWIKDVPLRTYNFVSDAVLQAFPNARANTKQGISLFVMLPIQETQHVLRHFGAAPVPFLSMSDSGATSDYFIQRKTAAQIQAAVAGPSSPTGSSSSASSTSSPTSPTKKAGKNKNNNADDALVAAAAATSSLPEEGKDKFVMPLDIVHQQLIYTKAGGNNTFVTIAGLGPAWWDICMVLMQSEAHPIVKLANECALLFQTPRNGQLVTPAEASNVIPHNVFFVTTDITNLLRNVSFDYDNIELPPVQNSQVQFGLVRCRNAAHVERLMAMSKYWYCHDIWRSKMPGLPPRSHCGASFRKFVNENEQNRRIANGIRMTGGNNNNENEIIPLIMSVDSLQTRMKDDCFSVELNPYTHEIEFTTYIACPLSEKEIQGGNLLEGPVLRQALERLTSKHDGSRKASMLDDDSSYSLSKVHCIGEPRRAVAITALFDMETLRFKQIKTSSNNNNNKSGVRIVEIVINEELDCGIVRAMEEGAMPLDEFNSQCSVRLDMVDKLFRANRDRAGDENAFFLFPEKSQMSQRIADTQFAREVTGRDEYLFRSVVNMGGTTMSDWTRHLFKMSRFVFSTGLRSQVIQNWNLDIEFGLPQFQGPAFKTAMQPLIQLLETRMNDFDAYTSSAAPLWEKFRTGSQEARSPVALELLASSLKTVEGGELLDLIAAATGILIDVDVSTPVLRILDGITSIDQTLPEINDNAVNSNNNNNKNQMAGALFADWRSGSGSGNDTNSSASPNNNNNLESLPGAKVARQYIGAFDITNDTEYNSLLTGTSPLRNGMHTLAHYLALRPPRNDNEKVKLKRTIEKLREDIIAAQDQRRKDSISNTLSCMFDQQVPINVKKVMLTGHVSRTSEYYYDQNVITVYLPKWSCFVAANVVSPRGSALDIRKIPVMTKVQILASVEDSGVGNSSSNQQITTDEFTNRIPPLELGDNNSTLFSSSNTGLGSSNLRSPTNSSRGWKFQAVRAPGGKPGKKNDNNDSSDSTEDSTTATMTDAPVWYKTTLHSGNNNPNSPSAGASSSPSNASNSSGVVSLVSFSLYTDERQAWKVTFPVLLGGTVVAGRGHDTAALERL